MINSLHLFCQTPILCGNCQFGLCICKSVSALFVLGCTLQAYRARACPVSRLKKDPRVNDRDISDWRVGGQVDGELTGLKQDPGVTPTTCSGWWGRTWGQSLPLGQERSPVTGGIDIRLARQATRETSRGEGVYLK